MSNPSSKLPLSTPLLPRLPVELLHHIIEQSVPSHYHSHTYDDRQLTLRHLCLSSRLFRQIAQPILEQFVQLVPRADRIDTWPYKECIGPTRVLSVLNDYDRPIGQVERAILNYHNLQELHFYAHWYDRFKHRGFDISKLSSLTALTHLTISSSDAILPLPTVFPSLRYLSLFRSNENLIAPLLRPSILPSLKVLALLYALPCTILIDIDSLVPQLDLLIVDPDTLVRSGDKALIEQHGEKLLMDVRYDEISGLTLPIVRHVRIRVTPAVMVDDLSVYSREERLSMWDPDSYNQDSEGNLSQAFDWFLENHSALKTSHKTLFLDQGLYDVLESMEGMQDKYNHLVDMCKNARIELMLEKQPSEKSADSSITPELLSWIDRRKEKANVETEEVV
ncbi:hypothetical protein JCM5353_002382 [Sporobolomyces roseus]